MARPALALRWICLAVGMSGTALIAAEPLVNRRVLIVNFVNQKKAGDADYLSVSVPEALIEPLTKTKSFFILPRDTAIAAARKLKFADADLFSDTAAVALGRETGADVVVIGNYVVVKDTVQIQTKAIDVEQGRVKASKTAVGKTDGTIFDTIQKLAAAMSEDMKQNLPPVPQREIIREKTVVRDAAGNEIAAAKVRGNWFFGFGAGGNVMLPDLDLGSGTLDTDPGLMAMAHAGRTLRPEILLGLTIMGMQSGGAKKYSNPISGGGTSSGHIPFDFTNIDNFATVSYFPFGSGFNIRAGAGVSWFQFTTSDISASAAAAGGVLNTNGTHVGFAGLAQAGYSFWLGNSFNLGINAGAVFAGSGYGSANRLILYVTCEWF